MFSEPVAPIRTMSALPPYCVRLALRKKLVVVNWLEGRMPVAPWKSSRNSEQPGALAPPPTPGSPGTSQFSVGAVSGSAPAT